MGNLHSDNVTIGKNSDGATITCDVQYAIVYDEIEDRYDIQIITNKIELSDKYTSINITQMLHRNLPSAVSEIDNKVKEIILSEINSGNDLEN